MIKGHEKFRISDENKERDFFVEVNWDETDKNVNQCKLLKVTFPDGKESIVKKGRER